MSEKLKKDPEVATLRRRVTELERQLRIMNRDLDQLRKLIKRSGNRGRMAEMKDAGLIQDTNGMLPPKIS